MKPFYRFIPLLVLLFCHQLYANDPIPLIYVFNGQEAQRDWTPAIKVEDVGKLDPQKTLWRVYMEALVTLERVSPHNKTPNELLLKTHYYRHSPSPHLKHVANKFCEVTFSLSQQYESQKTVQGVLADQMHKGQRLRHIVYLLSDEEKEQCQEVEGRSGLKSFKVKGMQYIPTEKMENASITVLDHEFLYAPEGEENSCNVLGVPHAVCELEKGTGGFKIEGNLSSKEQGLRGRVNYRLHEIEDAAVKKGGERLEELKTKPVGSIKEIQLQQAKLTLNLGLQNMSDREIAVAGVKFDFEPSQDPVGMAAVVPLSHPPVKPMQYEGAIDETDFNPPYEPVAHPLDTAIIPIMHTIKTTVVQYEEITLPHRVEMVSLTKVDTYELGKFQHGRENYAKIGYQLESHGEPLPQGVFFVDDQHTDDQRGIRATVKNNFRKGEPVELVSEGLSRVKVLSEKDSDKEIVVELDNPYNSIGIIKLICKEKIEYDQDSGTPLGAVKDKATGKYHFYVRVEPKDKKEFKFSKSDKK